MKRAGKLTAILLALTIIISSFTGTAVFAANTSSDFTIQNGVLVSYNLTSGEVTIPDSVTSIGDGAFTGCNITKVTIPNSVTNIGIAAFMGCTKLARITIPSSVTTIGHGAFELCTGLTDVTISNGVSSIGIRAFDQCPALSKIAIPASVTNIMADAFAECSNLTGIEVDNSNPNYCSDQGILFNKDKTTLIQYPTASTQTSYDIPSGVTEIGGFAFQDCASLQNIKVPNTVNTIGEKAFDDTPWLKSITDKFVILGNHVLYKYSGSETAVTVPDGVTSISSAFLNCTGIRSVVIPNSVTSIGSFAFGGCTSLTSVSIPKSVTEIGFMSFTGCTSLTSLVIPDSVSSIGYGCFVLSGLTSITLPDSVTKMDDYAFNVCMNLNSIKLSNKITSIGEYTFSGCTNLSSIKIPDGVTSIGRNAFAMCGLTSITIPASVVSIGKDALYLNNNVMICGYTDSEAQNYAKSNNLRFSPLLIYNGSTFRGSAMFDTKSYNMAPGNLYDIGVTLAGNGSTKTIIATSSQKGVATVKQLPNGNYRITGVSSGTTYVTCTIYDGNQELNHVSIRVTIGRNMKRSGVATRNTSYFD